MQSFSHDDFARNTTTARLSARCDLRDTRDVVSGITVKRTSIVILRYDQEIRRSSIYDGDERKAYLAEGLSDSVKYENDRADAYYEAGFWKYVVS